jgi:hypothetical protein
LDTAQLGWICLPSVSLSSQAVEMGGQLWW